jgi:hypothetical protein
VLVYSLPATAIPWPFGMVIALAPIGAGALLVHRRATGGVGGRDELRVLNGILAFFVLLDALVGLGGRYDLPAGAIATALALRRLNKQSRQSAAG